MTGAHLARPPDDASHPACAAYGASVVTRETRWAKMRRTARP